MIKVIGISAERVPIKDLSEFIYYKQKRIFSEEEFNKSKDLQKAIKDGKIIIVEENKDRKIEGVTSQPVAPEPKIVIIKEEAPKPLKIEEPIKVEVFSKIQDNMDLSKLDILLDKMVKLETKMDSNQGPSGALLEEMMKKIKELENRVSSNTNFSSTDEALMSTLRSLENKIGNISSGSGPSKRDESAIMMETYVPSITVEDANTHINLNVRTIQSGDDVSDALEMLKKMKNK